MKQKDPAFLFYFQDFLLGTSFLTDAEVGAYIRLLCHQADKGHITSHMIKTIGGQHWESFKDKFVEIPDEGVFINPRLQEEMRKRKEYAESRRKNRMGVKDMTRHMNEHMSIHMTGHMENENENGNLFLKEGVQGKERSVSSANIPSIEEVVEYFKSCGFTEEDGKNFWSHFESIGWEDRQGRRITNWNARVILWMNQGKQFRPKEERKILASADFTEKKNRELKKQFNENAERIKREGKFTSFKDFIEEPKQKGTKK